MNMISKGSFLAETSASHKRQELVKALTEAWEKKNSKAARAGGVSLMALTLAACGSSEDTTPFSQADLDDAEATGYDAGVEAAAEVVAGLTTSNNTLAATNGTLTQDIADLEDANDVLTAANGDLEADLETANETITTINDTDYASEQAAYNAGEVAGAESRDGEVQGLNNTITTINDTDYASEQAAYDAGETAGAASRDDEVSGLNTTIEGLQNIIAAYEAVAARTIDEDGEAIALSTSGTIIVAGTTAGADTLNASVNAGGNATVIFDFADADDTVVLTSADFTGVTAIEVQDGTVDFTAVTLPAGIALTLGSGAVLTAAQVTGLASIELRDGAASYDLTVNISVGDDIAALTTALTAAGAGGNITVAAADGALTPAQSTALAAVSTVENASGGAVVTTNAAPAVADAETTVITGGGAVALTATATVTDAEGNYNGGSITISFADAYVAASGITFAAGDFSFTGSSIIADSAGIAGDDDAIIGSIAYNGATDLDTTVATDLGYESVTITFNSDLVTDDVVTALLADIRIDDAETASGTGGSATTATATVTIADASGATASFSRLLDVDGALALADLDDDDAEVEVQDATTSTIDLTPNAAIDLNGAETDGMTIAFTSTVAGDTFAIENVTGAAVAGQARVVGGNLLYGVSDTVIGTVSGNGTGALEITLGTLGGASEAANETIINNILQGVTATYATSTAGARDITTTITSADAWGESVTNTSTKTIIQNFMDAEVNGADAGVGADAAGPLAWTAIDTAIAAQQVVEFKGNTYISLDDAAPVSDLTQAVADGLLIVPAGTIVRLQSSGTVDADLSGVTGLSALGTIVAGTADEPLTRDLTLTAAQADGLSGVVSGAGDSFIITDVDATMGANLSGFSAAAAATLAASGTLAADDEFTGDAGDFTLTFAGAFELTVAASVADGAAIETSDGAADITVTGVDGSFEGDLGGLVAGSGSVNVAFTSSTTLHADAQLDSADLAATVAADTTLTLSASQATAIYAAAITNTVSGAAASGALGSVGGSIVVTVDDMDTGTAGTQLASMNLTALAGGSVAAGGYAGTVSMTIAEDVTVTTAYEDANALVSVAAGATVTADTMLLEGETFSGAGAVSLTDLDDADAPDLSTIATTGGNTIAVTDAAVNTLGALGDLGNFNVTVGEGSTFVLTGAQATGLTITGADDSAGAGDGGKVIVTAISTTAVDLTGVTAGGVGTGTDNAGTFTVEASGALHADTDLGAATSINISNSDGTAADALTLTATAAQVTGRAVVDAADAQGDIDVGSLTVTGLAADTDLDAVSIAGTLTINVADGASVDVTDNENFGSDSNWSATTAVAIGLTDSTLTVTAAQIDGIGVSGADGDDDDDGDGVTNDADEVNESTLVIDGAVAANLDISSNVATSVEVNFTNSTVATAKALTATAAQVDGETIGGAGTVAISAMSADADLSGITATTVNVTATSAIDISSNTTLGSVDTFTATGVNVTVSEAQLESIVFAGTGTVTLAGSSSDDTIDASDETVNLSISAGSGDDTVTGGDGDDSLNGGSGDDTITGGAGADIVNAGPGADTYVFEATTDFVTDATSTITVANTDADAAPTTEEVTNADDYDLIYWVDGEDTIDVSAWDSDTGTAGVQDWTLSFDSTAVAGTSDAIDTTGTAGQLDVYTGTWDSANGDFTHDATGDDALIIGNDGTDVIALVVDGGAALATGDFIL